MRRGYGVASRNAATPMAGSRIAARLEAVALLCQALLQSHAVAVGNRAAARHSEFTYADQRGRRRGGRRFPIAIRFGPDMPTPRVLIITVLVVLATAAGWYVTSRLSPTTNPPLTAVPGTAVDVGGPFTLVAHTGKTVTDADFRGKYLLVNFGYTFCPDVCPTTLQKMALALDELGDDAAAVQPLFITIDPQRDTREVLAAYVAAFDPRIIGLTGSPQQIADVAKAYHAYYAKVDAKDGGDDYLMDHSAFIYLMGPDGRFLTALPYQKSPQEIAETIRTYMRSAKS